MGRQAAPVGRRKVGGGPDTAGCMWRLALGKSSEGVWGLDWMIRLGLIRGVKPELVLR
jgi:hypothetical protein